MRAGLIAGGWRDGAAVGGGIAGCAVACHLAALGQRGLLLVEQGRREARSGFGMLESRRAAVPTDFDPATLLKR